MKKCLAIPLFFVYFLAVTGMIIQQTCCQTDVSLALAQIETLGNLNCCGHMPQEQRASRTSSQKRCCSTKTVVVKTIHDQLSEKAQQLFLTLQLSMPAISRLSTDGIFPARHLQNKSAQTNAPPGIWQEIPLYKLHQRFTFYG